MKRETQIALVREALRAFETGVPPLYEGVMPNDPSIYVSAERFAREREIVFRRFPLVAGFGTEIPDPGDWMADAHAPVPTIVVRQADGTLKAFWNVCRHRGTRIAEGCGKGAKGFSCPYHAWSYDLDGRLESVPDEVGFEGIDRSRFGLVEIPVAERHGLVWVLPEPGGRIDPDEVLAGLGEDLAGYGFEAFRPRCRRLLRNRINWKLASDTFWEAYHLKVLHRKTISSLFLRNVGLFQPFGRNHRFVATRSSVLGLRDRPESEWDLLPHATILMNLFPNTVLIMQSDHAELYRIFPVAGRVDESVTDVTIFAPGEEDPWWNEAMDLLVGVIDEDYAISETIQRNFGARTIDRVVYGRYEAALAHFHASLREALDEPHPQPF